MIIVLFTSCIDAGKKFKPQKEGTEYDTRVTMTSTSSYINSSNDDNFVLNGKCSDHGRLVVVAAMDSFGLSATPSNLIPCFNGSWSTSDTSIFDLSFLADGMIYFTVSHADNLGQNAVSSISILKDSNRPAIINVTSSSGSKIYKKDDVVSISLQFSENVLVDGSPKLILNSDVNYAQAVYSSGSGTSELFFNYTVLSGHNSTDLDYNDQNAISGTIVDVSQNLISSVNPLPLVGGGNSLSDSLDIVVDTLSPQITDISTTATKDEVKAVGEEIFIKLECSEPVVVSYSTTSGPPYLILDISPDNRNAVYDAVTSTATSLSFKYVVGTDDYSVRLKYIDDSPFVSNGTAINDLAGNDSFEIIPNPLTSSLYLSNIGINAEVPRVDNVTSSVADGVYRNGDSNIDIKLQFNKVVYVSGGTPYLDLQVDNVVSTTGAASYVSGSGTNTLIFEYIIRDRDYSAGSSLAYIENNAANHALGPLKLNAATIKDLEGNNTSLILPHPGDIGSLDNGTRNIDIDSRGPSLVKLMTTLATDSLVTIGTTVTIVGTFNDDVYVIGSPALVINASPTFTASYASGAGTKDIIFEYIVGEGDVLNTIPLDYDSTIDPIFLQSDGNFTLRDINLNNARGVYLGTSPTLLALKNITVATHRDKILTITTTATGG